MGALCTACRHPDRVRIDAELAMGRPYRAIGKVYGLSKFVLSRHVVGKHIPEHVFEVMRQLREQNDVDVEALRRQLGDGLVFSLSGRKAALESLFEMEVRAGRTFNATSAAKEARAHDEASSRICGEIALKIH